MNSLLFKEYNSDRLLSFQDRCDLRLLGGHTERGHFSIVKTEALLLKKYWIVRVRHHIEKIIKNCVVCILVERKQGK